MAASTEPRSGLKYGWGLGFNGWHTEMDDNLKLLGRFGFHLSVKDKDLADPPNAPAVGDSYIVAVGAAGAWAGKSGQIAVYDGSAWAFGVPRAGWLANVEDEDVLYKFGASGWAIVASGAGGESGGTTGNTLEGLDDVALSGPAAKDALVYDGSHWVNKQTSLGQKASTWNAANKHSSLTLSNSNLTATTTSAGGFYGIRSNISRGSGKVYFETVIANVASAYFIGIANATLALDAFAGTDNNGFGFRADSGQFYIGGSATAVMPTPANGSVASFAFDFGAKLVWVRINGGNWNNNASANPATGAGGFSIAALLAGPYFVSFSSYGSGSVSTVRLDSGFTYAIPSGFSPFGVAATYNPLSDVNVINPTNGQTLTYNDASGLWENTTPANNTISVMGPSGAGHASGLVPDPGATAGTTRYLREDGSWTEPPGSTSTGGTDPFYMSATNKPTIAGFTLTQNSAQTGGTATMANLPSGRGFVIIVPQNTPQVDCVAHALKPIPAGSSWTITALLNINSNYRAGYSSFGLVVVDTTGKFAFFGNSQQGETYDTGPSAFELWNSLTSFNQRAVLGGQSAIGAPIWMRLTLSGGYIYYSVSVDGETWMQRYSIHISTLGTLASVGIRANANNRATTGNANNGASVSVFHYAQG